MGRIYRKMQAEGLKFSRAVVSVTTHARGIYNMKLIPVVSEEHETIVTNDLDFDDEHCVYILTGANRGGKTTITQAIGQLFL